MTQTTAPTPPVTPAQRRKQIVLAHGGGGQLTDELLQHTVLPHIDGGPLGELLDCGIVDSSSRTALTIDSFVVQPLFFPGGDIGRLAVSGTVNDLSVGGAEPLGLALSLILAEGLERSVLDDVMESIAATAQQAGVQVITGDTKVVGRGQADGMYITTAGIGRADNANRLHWNKIQPGDQILINGPIADHGLAVMLTREMPQVQSVLKSDVAPLNGLIRQILATNDGAVFMRDPTRSGVAGVVAELAERSGYHIRLDEPAVPVRPETRHAADMLGLDPLEVANEGKVVIVARPEAAQEILSALQAHPQGEQAAIIGEVEDKKDGICELCTELGGRRILQKPYGEQLPRIC